MRSVEASYKYAILIGMSIDKGNVAELEFILKATKKGLIVSQPVIQGTIYDFLADNSKRVIRVQVKSTFTDGPRYGLNIGQGSTGKASYSPDDIDIIACFIADLKVWYIIPISEIETRVKLTLLPNSIDSKWNKYKGAWDLLVK